MSTYTQGLSFTLIGGTAYSVSKGTATAAEVVIPAIYNELPVAVIEPSGFSGYVIMTSNCRTHNIFCVKRKLS